MQGFPVEFTLFPTGGNLDDLFYLVVFLRFQIEASLPKASRLKGTYHPAW